MPNGQAALFGFTAELPSETAVSVEHGYFAKTMIFPSVVLAVAATSADTVFNVLSTVNIIPGMILRVDSTGENVIVNSVISATSIAVQRNVGGIAPSGISAGINCFQIGNAFEEASLRPQALVINPVRITNLTQIFRNTYAISDTMRAIQVIAGETNIQESKLDCATLHATSIESTLFFGQKSQGTRNGQPIRYMDGLINIVGNISYYPSYAQAVNIYTAGATTNYTQLEAFLEPVFNQTTDPKVANQRVIFCGGAAKRVLTQIGRLNGTYYITDGQTNYGLQFSTLKTSRGVFKVIEHPLFNSNASWAKNAVVVDVPSIRAAYLGDRKNPSERIWHQR